ncbi:MAG: 16S rRNA (guanine(527)-N(7))-methyltransferase RsmG [Rhizobiales bacterium]|nr:16S rRNA (guanine(527)-N(7))-methyltransferase RsmG [Hyphomicrobiales bacterium]
MTMEARANLGFDVSRESLDRLDRYVSLLQIWQGSFNLIGRSTEEEIWSRHVADALQLLHLISPETRDVADLGSGGGLPGLVLAIATDWHVDLYESNGKKCAFLREVIRQIGAKATVHATRVESLGKGVSIPSVQVVTARALAPLPKLLDYAEPFLSSGAVGYFHKGQDVDAELTEATKYWKLRFVKHPSLTDSKGVILEVREARRVPARD